MVNTLNPPSSVAVEVSQLFRTKRVSEIRAIEANIRAEAEDRSHNLNTLLGTRYSDLLEASTAVTEGRDVAARNVRDALENMSLVANKLRSVFLNRSRPDAVAPLAPDVERRRETSAVGNALLHIVDSPEILYALLDAGKVFDAATRFVTSEKLFRDLDRNVAPVFVQSRWTLVDSFRSQIIAAAKEKITSNDDADDQTYASLMVSLMLVDPDSDILDGFFTLLDARLSSIKAKITGEVDALVRDSSYALRTAPTITFTASAIRDLVARAAALFCKDDARVLALLSMVAPAAATVLKRRVEEDAIAIALKDWLLQVQEIVNEYEDIIAKSANSFRDLGDAAAAVCRTFDNDAWKTACLQAFPLDAMNGMEIFLPLITRCSRKVAETSIQSASEKAVTEINNSFAKKSGDSRVGDGTWPSAFEYVVRGDIDSFITSSSAYPIELLRFDIVSNLNKSVGDAIEDVMCLAEIIPDIRVSIRFAAYKFLPDVVESLYSHATSLSEAKSLKTEGTAEFRDVKMAGAIQVLKFVEEDVLCGKALFIAQTASALICAKNVIRSFVLDSKGANDELDQFKRKVHDVCVQAYFVWASRLSSYFGKQLRNELAMTFALELRSSWLLSRRLDLAGSDSSGPESSIQHPDESSRYPSSPSPGAIRFAMAGCTASERAGGIGLPIEARNALNSAMRKEACRSYEVMLESYVKERECSCTVAGRVVRQENVFLQLLYDLTYFAVLLFDGDDEFLETDSSEFRIVDSTASSIISSLVERKSDTDYEQDLRQLQTLLVNLRRRIDPINLATLGKALTESAVSYVGRTSILLGTITRLNTSVSRTRKEIFVSSGGFHSANVAPIARTVARFPYLPAPMPSSAFGRTNLAADLSAKLAADSKIRQATATRTIPGKKREESSVVDYASKITENVGRFGKGLFESWRGVG